MKNSPVPIISDFGERGRLDRTRRRLADGTRALSYAVKV
jgi:hypothetical protein